jgi:hypothetical protein
MKLTSVGPLVVALSTVITAQPPPTDEQQIRALITKYDTGQTEGLWTKDRVFWSGRSSAR